MGKVQKHRMTYESAFQHARRGGGGLYTDWVSLRLSSFVTMALFTFVHPSLLTLANLVVGVAASLLAMLLVDVEPTWVIGLLVTAGWQLAYVLDSADGQIARATGKTSPSGVIVDILCDIAVTSTIVVALCVAVSHHYDVPPAFLALFAATWMENLVVTVLLRGTDEAAHRLLPSRSPLVALLKLPRDYGFMLLILGLSYAFWRPLLLVLVMGILTMNLLYLAAMIVNETRLSILATRSSSDTDSPTLETAAGEKQLVH